MPNGTLFSPSDKKKKNIITAPTAISQANFQNIVKIDLNAGYFSFITIVSIAYISIWMLF